MLRVKIEPVWERISFLFYGLTIIALGTLGGIILLFFGLTLSLQWAYVNLHRLRSNILEPIRMITETEGLTFSFSIIISSAILGTILFGYVGFVALTFIAIAVAAIVLGFDSGYTSIGVPVSPIGYGLYEDTGFVNSNNARNYPLVVVDKPSYAMDWKSGGDWFVADAPKENDMKK